jgi:hypothetical protein
MRCVLSFTTIPSRINDIRPTVESLLAQTMTPDAVYLWLPQSYRRLPGGPEVPKWLEGSGVDVHFTEDYGPGTKLRPTLELEKDPRTVVVTADDDMYYPPGWLSELVGMWEQFRCVVASRGRVFKDPSDLKYRNTRVVGGRKGVNTPPTKVDITTGVEGTLYQVGFFDNSFFDQTKCPSAFYNDDVWACGHLSTRGVPRMASGVRGIKTLPVHATDNLRAINRRKAHQDRIIEYFAATFGQPPTPLLQKRWRIVRRYCAV